MSSAAPRINRLRRLIRKSDCSALVVTNFTNVTYLTGFTGDDSYLLVTPDDCILLTDSRYTTQLEEECPDLDLVVRATGQSLLDALVNLIRRTKPSALGVESRSMSIEQYHGIVKHLPRLPLVTTDGLVEQLRMIKDREEVEAIRRAVECAERAFGVIRASLRADRTEKEITDDIEHQVRLFGGDSTSFPPIVAAGARAALPHARPTGRRVGDEDFVLIDWGARHGLYMSDLTRVLVTGRISPKLERVYEVVLKAQGRAIGAIKPGVSLEDVDAAARTVIVNAGYGKYFGHGLGHGIGLEIHEAPRLARGQRRKLAAGMVVTVEPGIYLPGWGGVRIEDDVLVTRTGHQVLSSLPKQLADCVSG
jgi:Xaa-Pro aminopeptidase